MATDTNQVVPYPGPVVQQAQIANRLNMLHFRGEPIMVVLHHHEYGFPLTLLAHPQICQGNTLRATWAKPDDVPHNLHQYRLDKIVIPDMASALELTTENIWLEHDALQTEIPTRLQPIACRAVCRRPGNPAVTVQLSQHSVCFEGELVDYSPQGMRLKVKLVERQSYYMFHPGRDITLTLARNDKVVFSGPVAVLRTTGDLDRHEVVVAPIESCTPRYQSKSERTKRYPIVPTPDINFVHPLTGDKTTLTVKDIAILGLSVEEDPQLATLMPGLIIEGLTLNVFGSPFVSFTGQVVYRKTEPDQNVVCGIAILDISVDDHYRLIGLVHRAEDNNSYVRLNQDPEQFFEFLFKTGFLYPAKYKEMHDSRDAFLDAYRKLYLNPNQIARCFVYLENGQVYGHVSALRIYRHTWLNHHHAALNRRRAGLKVLRQISDFHAKSFMLNPLQMRYVVGIWRPNNDFPSKFFGKFAATVNDPTICSVDTFSYMKVNLAECQNWDNLHGPWEVAKATRQDIREFEGFYHQKSGGLLPQAFDLTPDSFEDRSVAAEYSKSGLKRDRYLYAVRYGLDLKALVEVQDSDLGLNLSELTSAVYIYILDEKMVTPKILEFIQCVVAVKTKRENTTIMLYPHTYVSRYQLPAQKEYNVWVLNLNIAGTDAYMKHLSRYCK